MQSKLTTILCAANLAVFATAVPVVKRQSTAQINLVSAENEIAELATTYVEEEGPIAREVWESAKSFMASLAPEVLQPSDYSCPVEALYLNITTLDTAINFLNATQGSLTELLAYTMDSTACADDINRAFCAANGTLTDLHDYSYAVGSSTTGYPPVSNQTAERRTEIALQALQASLKVIPADGLSTEQSQIAFNHTQDAITAFAQTAGDTSAHSCPAEHVTPAASAEEAGSDAYYLFSQAVPKAYADAAAGDSTLIDFCDISAYMGVINDYVKA